MSLEVKTKYIAVAVILAILTLFGFGYVVGHKKGDRASQRQLDSLNGQIEYMTAMLHDQQVYIAQVNQQITTQKEAIKAGELDKETLKALNLKYASEVTRLKGQIKILADSISVGGMGVIIIRDCDSATVDTTKAIKLPFTFENEDKKWYQMNGVMDTEGKMKIDLTVPFSMDIVSGWNKKEKKYTASVLTENPKLLFNGVNSFKLNSIKPQRYSIGFFAGWGASFKNGNVETSPVIAVGFGYTPIRF